MDIKSLNGEQLRLAIAQAEKDIAVYERLKAAGKLLASLQAEQKGRVQAYEAEQANKLEREIARWDVREIAHDPKAADPTLLGRRLVTMVDKETGRTETVSLIGLTSYQKAAILRVPHTIPADILALADTPDAALERWLIAARRGFLAEDRAYVSKFL
ncbi:hypothetical protein [Paraburkholderia azotifigens]|uniref:Uncharacterized protein n=1 Tax=Paraburkholderia azotifigens TaxID=2057004 RepID=A0A5C6VML3_9BURK|nr:hypothetical protein [Paraburkholderia azotifigens]TXC86447.1 hypothetical protein FRZ40_01960 [Paraburkholderia azotifigens]